MVVRFRDSRGERLELGLTELGDPPPSVVSEYRERMNLFRHAIDESDFCVFKSLGIEELRVNHRDCLAMPLDGQWRLVIGFDGKGEEKVLVVMAIEDCH